MRIRNKWKKAGNKDKGIKKRSKETGKRNKIIIFIYITIKKPKISFVIINFLTFIQSGYKRG